MFMLSPDEFDKKTGEYVGPVVHTGGPAVKRKDKNIFTYKGSYQEWFDGLSEDGKLSALENEKQLTERRESDFHY